MQKAHFILISLFLLSFDLLIAREYNIKDFGAKGDDVTNDTWAVQKAIDQCSVTGGY